MENFPQTYEPTGSMSILEQFVGLKNFMNNKLNSNEFIKSTPQELTEQEKAQVRQNIGAGASTINIIDNLTSQSNIDALSANQGRVLNEKIDSSVQTLNQSISQNVNELQQDIDANGGDIAGLQGDVADIQGDISQLNQESARALKTPMSAPTSIELVAVNSNNSQIGISAGDGIKIENNKISVKTTFSILGDITSGLSNNSVLNLDDNISNYKYIITLLFDTNGGYYNYNIVPSFEVLNRNSLNSRVAHMISDDIFVNYYSNGETQLVLPYVGGSSGFYVYGVKE